MKLQCIKTRKCGWMGSSSELIKVPQKRRPYVKDETCPQCGGKTFYPINDDGTRTTIGARHAQ